MPAFEQAFEIVVGHEGGFSDERGDPGNWTGGAVGQGILAGTKYGVSAAAYPDVPIAELTLSDAQAIYRRDYWKRIRGDALPPPLALLVFDAAVNNGVGHAVQWLQAAAGVAVDGVLGDKTMAAVQAVSGNGSGLCAEFQAQRLSFMASLPTWRMFGLGWSRRLCALPYQGIAMSAA